MGTSTAVLTTEPTVSQRATPFFLDEGHDDAAARLPALRVVLRRDEVPEESLRQLTQLLGRGSVGIPLFDGWIARFQNRGCTVSVVARDQTLVVCSVTPPPLGWRRSVAGGGVVCVAFDVRSRSHPPRRGQGPESTERTVLTARLPVRLD